MKAPTDILRDEHRLILKALDILETAAARLAGGGVPSDNTWSQLLDWLRAFADRTHHAKEENVLFPAMIKAGAPAGGGPIDVMLEEHVQGRALIQAMAGNDPGARARAARDYVRLLRDHIDKEHEIVFPLADAVLDGPVREWVAHEFSAVDAGEGRRASLEYAEAVIDGLAATVADRAAR